MKKKKNYMKEKIWFMQDVIDATMLVAGWYAYSKGLPETTSDGRYTEERMEVERQEITNETVEGSTNTKPNQIHHYATNKSKTYTPQLEEVTKKYGLNLDDAWNKDLLPHQGRHPNEYHEYILDSMKQFDDIAQGNKDIFLKLFDGLKENVKNNPDMLYKNYWK